MIWKFLWQILFFFSMIMFVIMFLKFTKQGYKDLKKIFQNDRK
jgi:hypothetical protein|tara:strand:- start:5339 stop:5467 length:129 start_codon:yes stop_codon:yes gene_type:complete